MCRSVILAAFVIIAATTALSGEAPFDPTPDPKEAMVLDQYTPLPHVVAQAQTLEALVALAKPTIAQSADMLWMKPEQTGSFSFTFGIAQWVRLGKSRPLWALLRTSDPKKTESGPGGILTPDIQNASVRELVQKKDEGDHGGGNYARILLHEHGYDLYEIGIQSEGFGTGHPIEERRLYVLRGPGNSWQFIGEGPIESSGSSGSTSDWVASTARARLTGDAKAPVVLEFQTTSTSALTSEAEPTYPSLEIHREAMLAGALPATLQWLSDPYVEIDHGNMTLQRIINSYIYWNIDYTADDPVKSNQKEAATFRQLVDDRNPALITGPLPVGTVVQLPSRQEVFERPQSHGAERSPLAGKRQ